MAVFTLENKIHQWFSG